MLWYLWRQPKGEPVFHSDLKDLRRRLRDAPENIDLWIEFCHLSARLQDPQELARLRPDETIRDELWKRVTSELGLAGVVLPLYGLRLPQGARSPPGRWWRGNYRLRETDGLFYDQKTAFPLEVERLSDGARMRLVPEGPMLRMVEAREGEGEVVGRKTATVSAFLCDQVPVTVERYARFLAAVDHVVPDDWDRQLARPARPVVYVNYLDAQAYARWAGAKLLGSLGWEKAARGVGGGAVPWGQRGRPARRANLADATIGELRAGEAWDTYLEEVGIRPDGASPFGIEDCAGNIFEWVGREVTSSRNAVWGSCWYTDSDERLLASHEKPPGATSGAIGFRLGWPLASLIRSVDRLDLT